MRAGIELGRYMVVKDLINSGYSESEAGSISDQIPDVVCLEIASEQEDDSIQITPAIAREIANGGRADDDELKSNH